MGIILWRPRGNELGTDFMKGVKYFYSQRKHITEIIQSANNNQQELQKVA